MHVLVFVNYWIEKCTVKYWNSEPCNFIPRKLPYIRREVSYTDLCWNSVLSEGRRKMCTKIVNRKYEGNRHLGDLYVDGNIILNWILWKLCVCVCARACMWMCVFVCVRMWPGCIWFCTEGGAKLLTTGSEASTSTYHTHTHIGGVFVYNTQMRRTGGGREHRNKLLYNKTK